MLGTLIFPAISALMSHIAGEDEQGNIQGALHGAQSLAQAFGLLAFPRIYSAASVRPSSFLCPPLSWTVPLTVSFDSVAASGSGCLRSWRRAQCLRSVSGRVAVANGAAWKGLH